MKLFQPIHCSFSMNTITQYRKYGLITIILLLGFIIFWKLTPFIGGLLGAMTIYILFRNQMKYLVEKKRMKRALAAFLLVGEALLIFLIPLTFIVLILIDRIDNINIDIQQLIDPIQNYVQIIKEKTGYNLFKTENITSAIGQISQIGQYLMNEISSFFINVVTLLFVLYFMLVGGKRMEGYLYNILPFDDEKKHAVLHETNIIVKSNAIGIPLLGIIQGVIAIIGYYIFDVPHPFIFGFFTCMATLIPIIGTAIVWFPLVAYLALGGEWGNAIGLLAYGLLIITQVDNLIRFVLQKQMADIHPLVTIFGVIIGLSLFGFMGVIFGPLLLSMFLLCFDIFKSEYLDKKEE